ncbi:MAG: hypothetical protein EAX86_00775 [Candidatus Heimdallarchaeota archaeon]|nr:hypothetical protein [Candidatus Heimdallarchaeota archaeon]
MSVVQADSLNLVASIVLTLTPIIIPFFPYLFTRRKDENLAATIFNRAYLGFIVFYICYFIFPSILNSFVPNPTGYLDQEFYPVPGTNSYSTIWDSAAIVRFGTIYIPVPLLIKYLFQHFLNSIVIYLTYPIVILAFVFGISPIFSLFIILYQTWGEQRAERKPIKRLIKENAEQIKELQKQLKTSNDQQNIEYQINELIKENTELNGQLSQIRNVVQRLQEVQFEMETSPFQEITKRVKQKDWSNERELLKVLIAILPITLFLLMTILQLLGEYENPSLLQGTSMGWFLEIYFAYIATLVFSVYLIKASHLSRKGKFLGNQLYVTMVQSLSTVGAFMSGLAVILFLVQYINQIFVISFFVVYFIMVSIFFVLFLDIFEPFSIYLLIKLIESFKQFRKTLRRISLANTLKSFGTGVVVGFFLAIGFLTYRVFISGIFININTVQYDTFFWFTQNYATFLISAMLILFIRRWNWSIIGTAVLTYLSIFSVSLLINEWYGLQLYQLLGFPANSVFPNYGGTPLISPFITVTAVNLKWLTSVWKIGYYEGIAFIVPELYQIPVVWRGTGGAFLGILSIPYNLFHPFAIIMTYGSLIFLFKRKFTVSTQKGFEEGEEKLFYKSIFCDISRLPSLNELKKKSDIILISLSSLNNPDILNAVENAWLKVENAPQIKEALKDGLMTFYDLSKTTGFDLRKIHQILDHLTFDLNIPIKYLVTLKHREFSYCYEEVTIDSLHIMMLDGRAVLAHNFAAESQVEPALVAGLFSAITSFAKEAVRSEQLLKTIDHGDVVLTIEYAKWVFAAIFADSTSTELRRKLSDYLKQFELKYLKVLPVWLGDLDVFKPETEVIDEMFSSGA